jgi:phenylacetate-CoA ligase
MPANKSMPAQQPITAFDQLGATWRVRLKDRRHHPHALAHWPGVVAADAMSRDELLALQALRLDDLVRHAVAHVPFYRRWAAESGYQPGDPVRLGSLPVVTKADYADLDDFQSDAYPVSAMTTNKTSGSSGQPFRFRQHPVATDYSYCVLWRALHRFGLRPGHKRAFVWGRAYSFNTTGASRLKTRLKLRVRDWANDTLSIDAYSLGPDNVSQAVRQIDAYRPVYLHGYVSALYTLARHIIDQGRSLSFTPKLVVTESEALYPFQRAALEQAFRCPVIANYGSVELGKIAQPDPEGHARINEDLFIVERLPTGEAAITNLLSQAFPFIRYRIGDLIELEPGVPPGLPYACLRSVVGRTVDMIPLASGGHVHGVALAHLIDPHLDHIAKYQIRQTALDHFSIMLVPRKGTIAQPILDTITRDLRSLAGAAARVEFSIVEHITPGPTGKFRWVVSDLTSPAKASPVPDEKTPAH